jgi:SAM-dependent methyltransferase
MAQKVRLKCKRLQVQSSARIPACGSPWELSVLTGVVGDSDDNLAIRNEYASHLDGADGYYREFGDDYRNPHEQGVAAMVARIPALYPELDWPNASVLDLACGSGEVTLALLGLNTGLSAKQITASDPYTGAAFAKRTNSHEMTRPGLQAQAWSFADIANGALEESHFDVIVCAYALHLCEWSWLPSVCLALANASARLVIVTPHKRPELQPNWGWSLHHEYRDPAYRIRLRAYKKHL